MFQLIDDITGELIHRDQLYFDVETNTGTIYVTKHVVSFDDAMNLVRDAASYEYPFQARIKACKA